MPETKTHKVPLIGIVLVTVPFISVVLVIVIGLLVKPPSNVRPIETTQTDAAPAWPDCNWKHRDQIDVPDWIWVRKANGIDAGDTCGAEKGTTLVILTPMSKGRALARFYLEDVDPGGTTCENETLVVVDCSSIQSAGTRAAEQIEFSKEVYNAFNSWELYVNSGGENETLQP